MRIIGGQFRSLKLKMVPSKTTRETSDMVRGAIMNSLGEKIVDAQILDLFSGSGAYGLEAISRGAKHAFLNDYSKDAIATIKDNINHLKVQNLVSLWTYDYRIAIQKIKDDNIKLDIIFLDPPYEMTVYEEIVNELKESLNSNGIVVIEMHKNSSLSLDKLNEVYNYKESTYGIKKVIYLKKQ